MPSDKPYNRDPVLSPKKPASRSLDFRVVGVGRRALGLRDFGSGLGSLMR